MLQRSAPTVLRGHPGAARPILPFALALSAAALAPVAGSITRSSAGAQEPAAVRPGAPTIERPVAFDSAGRVLVVSPALAARLGLAGPAWPVTGPFVEARLFRVDGDGTVLAVVRPGGAVERWALDEPARLALVATITRTIAVNAAGLRADTTVVVSEPAGRGFIRTQTIRGLAVYGPAAATLVSDPVGSSVAYAVAVAASYAIPFAVTQSRPVTRAQSYLAGNMSLGLAAAGLGLATLIETDEASLYGGAALVGGIAGAVAGVGWGAGMSDAEAASAGNAGFLAAATVMGTAGALGAWDGRREGRGATIAGVAALATGYALGPRYARRTSYRVTAGDAQALLPSALVGAALAGGVSVLVDDDAARMLSGAATAGFVAGILVGDRALVRRVDHTESEASLVRLGTAVGAGAAGAIAGAAGANEGTLIAAALGGLLGLAATEAALAPERADGIRPAARRTGERGAPPDAARRNGLRGARLELSPTGAALAAAGVRGRFPLAHVTF
jgi:hypothetical protein